MIVGIPKEVKNHEYRVAATPEGVRELVARGHRRRGRARRGRGLRDRVTRTTRRRRGDPCRRRRRLRGGGPDREGQGAPARGVRAVPRGPAPVHLPAPGRRRGAHRGSWPSGACRASPTRPCRRADGRLPLLAPMSEIAGRMAPQVGAAALERPHGGRGVLMGGVSGVAPARVVVLGAGMAGCQRGPDRRRHGGRGHDRGPQRRPPARHRPGVARPDPDRR